MSVASFHLPGEVVIQSVALILHYQTAKVNIHLYIHTKSYIVSVVFLPLYYIVYDWY